MSEIWKDIQGYEGLYQVSNLGNVKSLERIIKYPDGHTQIFKSRVLKYAISKRDGYKRIVLCRNSNMKTIKIHRLVALAFVKNTDNKPQVNHIDGDKGNNVTSNLEWCTNSENQIHAYKTGLNKLSENSIMLPRKVRCITNNKIYESMVQADRETGAPNQAIWRCCNNIRKSTRGLTFEYA